MDTKYRNRVVTELKKWNISLSSDDVGGWLQKLYSGSGSDLVLRLPEPAEAARAIEGNLKVLAEQERRSLDKGLGLKPKIDLAEWKYSGGEIPQAVEASDKIILEKKKEVKIY